MEQLNEMAPYHMVVFSQNHYFWLGLQTLVATMATPRPELLWLNAFSAESLACLRLRSREGKTLIVTGPDLVDDVQICLPTSQVILIASTHSLEQVKQWLEAGEFPVFASQAPVLTRAEIRVCTLYRQGLNTVRIARVLNKSPKTIHSHKRNVMAKFHCRNLVEFHRTLTRLEQKRFYQ